MSLRDHRPRLGIVIPFHFDGDVVGETIRALRNQDFDHWHCVVVIDGATPSELRHLEEISSEDARLEAVSTPGEVGPAAARNVGAERLPDDCVLIMFLDCDDVIRPGALALLIDSLAQADDAIAGAYGLSHYFGERPSNDRPPDITGWARDRHQLDDRGRLTVVPIEDPTCFEALVINNWISTPGQVVLRRSAFDAVGGFRTSVPRATEDWDFWLRVSLIGCLRFVDEVVLDWRQHGGSPANQATTTRNIEHAYRQMLMSDDVLSPHHQQLVVRARHVELARRRNEKLRYAKAAVRRGRPDHALREVLRAVRLAWEART